MSKTPVAVVLFATVAAHYAFKPAVFATITLICGIVVAWIRLAELVPETTRESKTGGTRV